MIAPITISSNIARRAAASIGARRPLTAVARARVQDLESTLQSLRLSQTKDVVKEIRQLMSECKTNHSIRIPNSQLEEQVFSQLGAIRSQLNSNSRVDVGAIDAEILGLKRMVKSTLYKA